MTWSSSDADIVTVDENGTVTAVAQGTAVITAYAGNHSDTCTVTVLPRMEYRLDALSLHTENGEELSTIPTGPFLVTIPITKLTDSGDALVLLACYTADGQVCIC